MSYYQNMQKLGNHFVCVIDACWHMVPLYFIPKKLVAGEDKLNRGVDSPRDCELLSESTPSNS